MIVADQARTWQPDPELVRRRDIVLAHASIVAEAAGAKLDSSGGHAPPDSREPVAQGEALLDQLRRSLVGVASNEALRRWVYHAEAALDRARRRAGHQRDRPERQEERDRRVLIDYEGVPAEETAAWERLSAAQIRTIRREADRYPDDGRRRERRFAWATPAERRVHVLSLRLAGRKLRDIAAELGVSHQTVIRDLEQEGAA